MDWNGILYEVIIGVIGLLLTAIGTIIATAINKHVSNENLKITLNSLHDLIRNSVLQTYQTYVQELKDKDMFDVEAQKTALSACLHLIKTNMSNNVLEWLTANVRDVDDYLKGLIEAQIGALKNSGK